MTDQPRAAAKSKTSQPLTLKDILKEVKETILVYLTPAGIKNFQGTPYLRHGQYLACSAIVDERDPHYLHVQARYYTESSKLPQHAYLSLPHNYVKYMVSDAPFRKTRGSAKKPD
jgi:hypothetical protein